MKKLILLALLGSYVFAGNFFSTLSGMNMPEVKPEQAYTVDTNGLNPRIYTWVQKLIDGRSVQCITLFPNASGEHSTAVPAMQCIILNK